jgi:prolyl oligopeptidase
MKKLGLLLVGIGRVLRLENSWTRAYAIWAYDPKTKTTSNTDLQPTGPHDEFRNVDVEEVKFPSHDGTLVPLSIVHPKHR